MIPSIYNNGTGDTMANELILVRYGEIGLKGRNRSQFLNTLAENIRRGLANVPSAQVTRTQGRLYVEWAGEQKEHVYEVLGSTFGVVSFSPAVKVEATVEAIFAEAARALAVQVEQSSAAPRTFKVEARRADKTFPLNSMELNRQVGAHLLKSQADLRVDVRAPDVTVNVEVRDEGVLVFSQVIPGPGGLPVGSSNRAMCLLSGGIDSPVAAWFAMKRGIRLEAVHFHSFPFTSERSLQKVIDLSRILARYSGWMTLHVVHFTEIQTELQKKVPDSFGITIMRRFMVRIAERIAAQRKGLALVTGESVGQVASQTLESMAAINDVTTMPILRPLVSLDKAEIIDHAQRIGSYETSILPYEDCCTLFVPKRPQTRPRIDRTREIESVLDVDGLIERALAQTRREIIEP